MARLADIAHYRQEAGTHTVAKNLIVELTDDIDGSIIADGSGESIEFSVDGVNYAIDLKDKNAEKFRKALGYYIEHAAKIGGRKRKRAHVSRPGRRRSGHQEVHEA